MNILVTGGAGYLGSVLLPKLLARGHRLRVVDVGYFGISHLRSLRPGIELIREDIRRFCDDRDECARVLDGIDCVIHLAAISNDPSAELNPGLTEQINFKATQALAEAAKARGIKFLFSSSCSVYGEAPGEVDEEGTVNPLTAYAHSKVNSDRFLASIATPTWRPVSLRNGTLYGHSSRMRFDLVINIFAFMSTLYNEVRIFGDGLQWRPFLHIADCARAFIHFAEAPESEHLVYNIAHENLRVIDLVEIFRRINPQVQVKYVETADKDLRNYHASTARMKAAGFEPRMNVLLGAEEIVDAIVTGVISDPESIFYRNAKWMKELTQFGDTRHKEFVGLMETLASVMPQQQRRRDAA
jgi:nucleoside-diphosphate-sugar epimerase